MKSNVSIFIYIWVLLCGIPDGIAQDLLSELENQYPEQKQYELATFKGSRIAIGHSIQNRRKGVLDLVMMHRYWNVPNARTQSFIADKLNARIALEYGITDRLTFGVGGSTLNEIFDGFVKYQLIRQRKDRKGSPLSMTLFQNSTYRNRPDIVTNTETLNRFGFTTQLLIARKFTPKLSLQIAPTLVYRTKLTLFEGDPQAQFALGLGGRYKLNGHVALVSEYYYVANPIKSRDTYGAFALGINWEVKNLLLQFQLTNVREMVEEDFIIQTPNNFNFEDGNFVFGANASVSIQLFNAKPKAN